LTLPFSPIIVDANWLIIIDQLTCVSVVELTSPP